MSREASASTWSRIEVDPGELIVGVSCQSTSLCVAVDNEGNVLTSTSSGTGGSWSVKSITHEHLTGVSCASPSLCVAVDGTGEAFSSEQPEGGEPAWHRERIEVGRRLAVVSCGERSTTCVVIDEKGNALASADPTSSKPTWNLTPIGSGLAAVSCASSGLCVVVDAQGSALASDSPTAARPEWNQSNPSGGGQLSGVSCMSDGFCIAVNKEGDSFSAVVPKPTVKTSTPPTEVTYSSAVLAGTVNLEDAVPGECKFEYGTTVFYAQSANCESFNSETGASQSVKASISGLSPNTTYHYRIRAGGKLRGESFGEDQTFTTAISPAVPIVYPHPSITGTPAPNQSLLCQPGVFVGSAVVTYVWLRDQVPIPRAVSPIYTVSYRDSGHHLQCQVTATDGGGSATAKSEFVTVPVEGVPASAGETSVGKATYRGGRVSVPVYCSSHASNGCQVTLRLTAVETLSGRRVVAIAARSKHSARKSASGRRQITVALASVRVHLAPGTATSLTASLNSTGRHLLASYHHFTALLNVSGTVIGVIESQLSRQTIALGASSRSASRARHATHHH